MILWTWGHHLEVVAGDMYPAWCDQCQASTAVRVRLYILTDDGPWFVGLWFACTQCDEDRFGDDGETPYGFDPDSGILV